MSHTSVLLAGRYRLEYRIAVGGVGEVWRAADVVLGRPVAVKLLRAELAGQPEMLARFRAEARHGGSLCHPGIAQVYDYGDAHPPDPPFLVMEYVDGPSLAEVLADGPIGIARTLAVLSQAAEALDAAHRAGLLHRDIKPGNLLLGPGDKVKITDFGLAHTVGAAPVTQVGVVVGTAAYLAPERTVGEQATPASDLYALGIVAYECLAGGPPFTGSPLELMTAHLHRSLPALPLEVPDEVVALIWDVTAKEPAARPARAAEVAARAAGLRDIQVLRPLGPRPRDEPLAGQRREQEARQAGPHEVQPPKAQPEGTQPPGPHERALARPSRGKTRGTWSLALGTAIALAGIAAWLLPGVLGGANARQGQKAPGRGVSPPASAAPSPSALEMVHVNTGSLIGEPVAAASRTLRLLGLQPRVVWVASQQPRGTVVSVLTSGKVPRGSVVVLTASQGPAGLRSGGAGAGGTPAGGAASGGTTSGGTSSGGTSTVGSDGTAKSGSAGHGTAGGNGNGNGGSGGSILRVQLPLLGLGTRLP